MSRTNPLRSLGAQLLTIAMLATATFVASTAAVVATAAPAAALCLAPPLDGSWENITSTRSIEAVDFGFECGDVCYNGVCGRTGMTIRLWGSCHPTNCDWGYADLDPHGSGGWYRATYSLGWATKSVWVRAYGSYLRVWVWTNFHDGRTDYASNDWLLPA